MSRPIIERALAQATRLRHALDSPAPPQLVTAVQAESDRLQRVAVGIEELDPALSGNPDMADDEGWDTGHNSDAYRMEYQ